MDVGVGSFVAASALTSRQSRGIVDSSKSRIDIFISTVRGIIPVLVIGVARILAVKASNYQEHVSEYGVHWNFFFSLALITITINTINVPIRYNAIFGVSIILGNQIKNNIRSDNW
jgi:phosphatidylinositol glycan class W